MNMPTSLRNGGELVVDQLINHGINTVFGVPGESYLPVLDAIRSRGDHIRMIVNRQEGGAAFMAEAWAKFTGSVGVCIVTRGPGATNAAIGVHTAHQDSTPFLLLIGQVGNDFVEREAFQEIDYRRMFGPMAKWVAQIDRIDRVPEFIAHAFHVAQQGRPGPVVLALPEDMLREVADVADATVSAIARSAPTRSAMQQIEAALAQAQRPILLIGGPGWTPTSCAAARRFAQHHHLPVACSFRRQDLFENDDPLYIGEVGIGINPKLAARIAQADLVIALGSRLGEMTTSGYSIFEAPNPKQTLIHILAGPEELGRVYAGAVLVQSDLGEAAEALAALDVAHADWSTWLAQARHDLAEWQAEPAGVKGAALNPWQVMRDLKSVVGRELVFANGAGNFSTWAHRFWKYRSLEYFSADQSHRGRYQLAPLSGAMGYGVPAGIAARLSLDAQGLRERPVIALTGDGDFMMTGQELATAVQYRAGIIVLLFDNGLYGTIRMHQEREFPAREIATVLVNPDFAALAKAYGAFGEAVENTAQFMPALERALAFTRETSLPALLHVKIDPETLTPNATLTQIRERALAANAFR
jgi:acetolactate synthase-1/2/3 large subunit